MNTYQFAIGDKYDKSRIQLSYVTKFLGVSVKTTEVGNVPVESPFIGSMFRVIEDTNRGPVSIRFRSGEEMNRILSAFAYASGIAAQKIQEHPAPTTPTAKPHAAAKAKKQRK